MILSSLRLNKALYQVQNSTRRFLSTSSSTSFKNLSTTTTSKELGDVLELRVARIARLLGYRNIRRNILLIDKNGNKSEVDVVFGLFFPIYVECKNYSKSGTSVGLEEVAKWRMVLELNNIPLRRGLFITTSSFSPRATTIGIKCLDKNDLIIWEKYAESLYFIKKVITRLVSTGFISLVTLLFFIFSAPFLVEKYPFFIQQSFFYKRIIPKDATSIQAIKIWLLNELAIVNLSFSEFKEALNEAIEEGIFGNTTSHERKRRDDIYTYPIQSTLRSFFEDNSNKNSSSSSSSSSTTTFEETPIPLVIFFETLIDINRKLVRGWKYKEQQLLQQQQQEEEKIRMNKLVQETIFNQWWYWMLRNNNDHDTSLTTTSSSTFHNDEKEEEKDISVRLGIFTRLMFDTITNWRKN
jgi:hypothetical protein